MKHIGKTLKAHIEREGLQKNLIAAQVGITPNYMSVIFGRPSLDAELLEKLCRATNLSPMSIFELPANGKVISGVSAKTIIGDAAVNLGDNSLLSALIEEKERTIAEKERVIEEKERIIAEKERIISLLSGQSSSGNETQTKQ